MIIVLKKNVSEEYLDTVKKTLVANGMSFDVLQGVNFTLVPVVGDLTTSDMGRFRAMPGVEKIINVSRPYYLVSKDTKEKTVIDLGNGVMIGEGLSFISGPCSVESFDSLDRIALFLSDLGVKILRGGTYKLRTSPYSFQGLGEEGLKILREVSDKYNMKCISEIVDVRNLDLFMKYTDIIQVGARNMMNFSLLKELGRVDKPILLKRSLSAKVDDFLLSAEYLVSEGNENVILCERGIQSFDDTTRSTVNIASIPLIKGLSHLPLVFDPSHSIGIAKLVPVVSEAAVVLGVDGLMIETHYNPTSALSDGYQTLSLQSFEKLYSRIKKLSAFVNERD
ncbi:MAG TPA: bifunctional 3-deoxy-7-phosphoheptulonate synthase/chorismate mutase [bacterium]|nr:bifunctional 3-deoxy-7-phosphoheptulonate synthase/chorismate mutase [bacterium]HPS29514.1 bifunctional 3-deoxy-7-phosphoheptulonate synthase/chorismate mutase [bacterium]